MNSIYKRGDILYYYSAGDKRVFKCRLKREGGLTEEAARGLFWIFDIWQGDRWSGEGSAQEDKLFRTEAAAAASVV